MRPQDELWRDARDDPPFSNSDEGYGWMANWCDRCVHDKPAREGNDGDGCPLILIALCGKTPIEWMEQDGIRLADQYHCIEFRDERDDPPGPKPPEPQIPGQGLLFNPQPFEGVRMFTDVVDEIRPVEAGAR